MTIAIVTHNYPLTREERSNAGSFVYDLSNLLTRKNITIIVFVVNSSQTKFVSEQKGKLTVYYLGKGSIKKKLGELKLYSPNDIIGVAKVLYHNANEINKIAKKEQIDFFLAMWAIPSGIIAYFLSKKRNIPYGIWALGSDIYRYQKIPVIKNIIKKAIKNASLLYADGIELSEKVTKFTNRDCKFLPSATLLPGRKLYSLPIDKSKINFIYLGRMEYVKGPDILLSALSLLHEKNYHMYFLGDGFLLDQLKMKCIQYDLVKNVTFIGNVNDKEKIYSYLSAGDYLIIPSRSDSIPLVMSEGAHAGIPVIVSDVGDMAYFVKKYTLGYVFPSEDSKKLTEILKKIIKKGKSEKKEFHKSLISFGKLFNLDTTADTLMRDIHKI